MSLSGRLDEPSRKPSGLPCSIGQLCAELPTDEAAALGRMLHELGWSASRIYDELVNEGHHVGFQSINRHRAGTCRCGRPE